MENEYDEQSEDDNIDNHILIDDININDSDISEYDSTILASELQTNLDEENNFYNNYNTTNYKSDPILSKYEKTLILSHRIQHLTDGCNAFIDITSKNSYYDIALEELIKNKLPYIIKRKVGDTIELWKLSDLK
tara:strand:+ start:1629 stop:2030 length:402 start_codon:yes stop_codon:yes gene_type:complete